jgi:muconolactone D-isomerase
MEFHVAITIRLPGDLGAERRAELLAAELERGRQLHADGTIERIWRVPGALRNVGIWHTADAGSLHDAIASLPCFPWLEAEVTALAQHPVEEAADA